MSIGPIRKGRKKKFSEYGHTSRCQLITVHMLLWYRFFFFGTFRDVFVHDSIFFESKKDAIIFFVFFFQRYFDKIIFFLLCHDLVNVISFCRSRARRWIMEHSEDGSKKGRSDISLVKLPIIWPTSASLTAP